MIKTIILCFVFLLLISSISPDTYEGQWEIEGGSIIKMYRKDNFFYGKIHKRAKNPISNQNGLDNKNPDSSLRHRKLLGIDILKDLRYEDGELCGGTIYNADSGKTYTVRVWIDEDDLNLCYIRAYKGILFKTFTAKRVR